MSEFAEAMRARRRAAGMSVRALARAAHLDPGHVSRLESGHRWPTEEAAVAIDQALDADGELYALARRDPQAVDIRESERLAELLSGPVDGSRHLDLAARLATDYLAEPAAAMGQRAAAARRATVEAIRRGRGSRDLARAAGQMSGVLAYAALDTGHPDAALAHAAAAWAAAEAAGDDELRAWVRGTQSLIERFRGRYVTALRYAEDGLRYAPAAGTARARLLSGVAQCSANLGDRLETYRALAGASGALEHAEVDEPGVLGFSSAKLWYYGASSLMWLPEPTDAQLALIQAERAIQLWQDSDPAGRSLDDEALAHVYAATAAINLGEVEVAASWLAPILDLPEDRRISWIAKRLRQVAELLTDRRFAATALAGELVERIRAY